MAEPVSASTATTIAVTGVSIAAFIPPTTIGVVYGALAGAIFLIILIPNYNWKEKIGLFFASFMVGIIAADAVAALLNENTPDSVNPGSPLGALVASFLAFRALLFLNDWMNKKSGIEVNLASKKQDDEDAQNQQSNMTARDSDHE